MRVFIALELKDSQVRERIANFQRRLSSVGADLKLVNPEQLHFTLKFIGEVPDIEVDRIASSLERVEFAAFDATFEGVGVFPSFSRVNVVWVGIKKGADEISRLSEMVKEATKGWGKEENREFQPHITVARVRSGRGVSGLKELVLRGKDEVFGISHFKEFQLKKSVLTPAGPIYSDIKVYRLIE